MQRSTVLTAFQRTAAPIIAAIFVAVIMLAVVMVPRARAQDAASVPSAPSAQVQKALPSSSQPFDVKQYSKPQSSFPNPLAPYTPRHVTPPNLANTSRIDQLMRDGKLYISMNDAVALALENNLDIAIARYNLNIADTDVWRAKAGASTLGVNNGVVQNTPGGGVEDWSTSWLGPRRNLGRSRGRRHRRGRPSRIDLRQRPEHHQLRPRSYGHAANRSQQYSRIHCFQSCLRVEHHHWKLLVPAGLPVGYESVGRV